MSDSLDPLFDLQGAQLSHCARDWSCGRTEFRPSLDGIKRPIEAWNRDQTLRSAFAVSCLWYYENLAARIGLERYKRILAEVGYGNGDVTEACRISGWKVP